MDGPQRILFVDHDAAGRAAFAAAAAGEGFPVDVAASPDEAFAMAGAAAYALIAAVDDLPAAGAGLGAIDALQRLQPDATYMMVGANCDVATVLKAFHDHGVSFVLDHPEDPVLVAGLIRRAIEAHWERATQRQVQRSMVDASRALGLQRQRLEAAVTADHTQFAEALLGAFAMRGHETEAHCRRLARHALTLAAAAGLTGSILGAIEQGALLHDIGKMGIPDAILLKAGPLTPAEWTVMRTHPAMGARLLAGMDYLRGPRELVAQHHERWDGTGYPRGLAGADIDLGARIFAPCDALDALLSDRPYRRGASIEAATAEIVRSSGSHFDPEVIRAFRRVPAEAWLANHAAFPER